MWNRERWFERQTSAAILDAVSDGESQFQDSVSPSLLNVVARDGDGVEVRHVLGKCTREKERDHNRLIVQHFISFAFTFSSYTVEPLY